MQRTKVKHRFLGIPYISLALLISDFFALSLAFLCAFCIRLLLPGALDMGVYQAVLPLFLLICCLFALLHLYPGALLLPAEELKRLVLASSLGFALLFTAFFLLKSSDFYSRLFFLLNWAFSIIFVPLGRYTLRHRYWRKSWWQQPALLLTTAQLLPTLPLYSNRVLYAGLKWAACVLPYDSTKDSPAQVTAQVAKAKSFCQELVQEQFLQTSFRVQTCDMKDSLQEYFENLRAEYGDVLLVLHIPAFSSTGMQDVVHAASIWFKKILLLPGDRWLGCAPNQIVLLGQSFGLMLQRNLADVRRLRLKRGIDLLFTILTGVILWPLLFVLSVWIKLDSEGPVFYRHKRIGKDGKIFYVYKFRTMRSNSDTILHDYLAAHPDAAEEWAATQKLKNDPRVTKVGALLRKTSLDELPQIINILKGEMSLVGPRPIVAEEVAKYGDAYALYTRCLPGITGLWQISGRNDTSYEERVLFDTFYSNNWSVWFDIYIILRTVPEVLFQRGAY